MKAPCDFLQIRRQQFPPSASHVTVNEDAGRITLFGLDQSEIGSIKVHGNLTVHHDFERLGVNNTSIVRQPVDLAKWIKMNRSIFESKDVANNLISELRNFKAKINKELEQTSDDRANYTQRQQQAVESNLPDTFKIKVPLFVGEAPHTFVCEVIIDPDDFSCALISPDAADLVRREKAAMIAEQVARFDGYAIIYQ